MPCATCKGLQHVKGANGFTRCPECYSKRVVQREFQVRGLPASWEHLNPVDVRRAFGDASPVAQAIEGMLSNRMMIVHGYGLPSWHRTAFAGALAYGFLANGRGLQVLDSADLSMKHFSKTDERDWLGLKKRQEACVFTLGREVEARVGFFYLRETLERATMHGLPFVLLTDYPLSHHAPRYPDLMPLIAAAGFDITNLPLTEAAS